MTTTWEITKNEIKRSQQPTPDSDQFHTTDKSQFYRTIDDADQTRWDHIRETLSPRLTTSILVSNQRYEGHEDQMSSLDVLDKVAGMVSNGVSEADIFPLLESRIQREENASQQRNRNEFWQTIDQPPKEWVNQDAYLVRRNTDRIYLLGMEKKVSFLIRARRSYKSPRMVSGWKVVWVLVFLSRSMVLISFPIPRFPKT